MSEGPIKQWRDAWKPEQVSTSPSKAVHAYGGPARAYCGRRGGVTGAFIGAPSQVTCSDCLAAMRADHEAEASHE